MSNNRLDSSTAPFTDRAMTRAAVLVLCLTALAGCSALSAAGLGLTGATPPIPPEAPSDATVGLPGIRPGTGPYTPSLVPTTGGGRYFGYQG